MGPNLKAVIKNHIFESTPAYIVGAILITLNIVLWIALNAMVEKLADTFWPFLGIMVSVASTFWFGYFVGFALPDINEARRKDLENARKIADAEETNANAIT